MSKGLPWYVFLFIGLIGSAIITVTTIVIVKKIRRKMIERELEKECEAECEAEQEKQKETKIDGAP